MMMIFRFGELRIIQLMIQRKLNPHMSIPPWINACDPKILVDYYARYLRHHVVNIHDTQDLEA